MRWLIYYYLPGDEKHRTTEINGPGIMEEAIAQFRDRTGSDIRLERCECLNQKKPKCGRTIRTPRKSTAHSIYKAMRK